MLAPPGVRHARAEPGVLLLPLRVAEAIEEVGESPTSVVHEVVKGVQERAGEAEPPVEIAAGIWYPTENESAIVDAAGQVSAEEESE